MSMYNMLFGENPISLICLKMLGLTEKDVGRFRDAYIEDGKIIIYTRNGGGNRGHWDIYTEYKEGPDCPCPGCVMQHRLPKHPNYIRDYDDEFDSTYAYIEFTIPEQYAELIKALESGQYDVKNVNQKFNELLNSLQKGE